MRESEIQKVFNYPVHPTGSKNSSDKGFVNIDTASLGGTLWVCFIIKDNMSFSVDSFRGAPDKSMFIQLPKPIKYHY